MFIRSRPLFFVLLAIALPLAFAATCATTNPNARKYPSRPGGCQLRVFHGLPDVKEWDDLGIAHVDCPLDLGRVQCLHRLKMEACREGGDILFDVPNKPLRPTDQGMVYTGHVAHTKVASADAGQGPAPSGEEEADGGSGADDPTFEKNRPVEPIAPVAAPPPGAGYPKDGGPG